MDFCRDGLLRHHQRVALLSLRLAEMMGLPVQVRQRLFCSSIIHDAGSSTWKEKASLEKFDIDDPWDHCQKGYRLLVRMRFLAPVAEIVLHHHDRWAGPNPHGLVKDEIPLESRIIHLADRVDVLIGRGDNVLDKREDIIQKIKSLSGRVFDPEVVEAFEELSKKESIWFDLTSQFVQDLLEKNIYYCNVQMEAADLLEVSEVFAAIIDGKSPFTHRHSRLVAEVAAFLAERVGFRGEQVTWMRVAGLLHDLGKLSVPDEILEKPGPLTKSEFNVIKQHTYYTYHILNQIEGFDEINQWASYHHEKINGYGYPFRLKGSELSMGARIMAISDIFSALIENRPYRPGLSRDKVEDILLTRVRLQEIDGDLTSLLLENYEDAAALIGRIAHF